MARYRISAPAYIEGEYYFASNVEPAEVVLPDDVAPSRKWEPLDAAASAALEKLGVKKAVSTAPTPPLNPASATPAPARPRRASDREHL
jgi:hypothetical protein